MTRENYNEIINKAMQIASGSPECNALFELELLKNGLRIVAEIDVDVNANNDMTPIPIKGVYYTYPYPSFIVEM